MNEDDWGGLPPIGTRVHVPHGRETIEGEVVALYELFGGPIAQVEVELPYSYEPYETHFVKVGFGPGEISPVES